MGLWPEDGVMFLNLFPPSLYCSRFFSSQALRKDTQAFVLNLCFTHIPLSVCSCSRIIPWQQLDFDYCLAGEWNLLGPAASVVSASQLESYSSPLTPHLIQITPSSAVAATRGTVGLWQAMQGTVGDEQQHPCSLIKKSPALLLPSMKPSHSPRIFNDYNCVSL